MTPGRLLWILRKDLKRGLKATYYDYAVSGKINRWKNPSKEQPPQLVPLYTLCSKDTVALCQWMLASWFHFTRRNWNVIVYEDGTLDDGMRDSLRRFLPEMQLISPQDREGAMGAAFQDKPACAEYRRRHPLAKKIFDIPVMAGESPFLLIDTDVLFFGQPEEILRWIDGKPSGTWFNRELTEPSPIPLEVLEKETGVRPWAKVNSGLCLIPPHAVDLDFCEYCLKKSSLLSSNLWRVEQTLFALCGGKTGQGGLLPSTYEVSLAKRRLADGVSRHYVGAVRNLFYAEGIAELEKSLLSD